MPRERDEQWDREHDALIEWVCPTPGCGFSYEDRPGTNEASKCPDCGARCRRGGESFT
jgi:predicted Zn-ribbon and HTH transcriptional regulator